MKYLLTTALAVLVAGISAIGLTTATPDEASAAGYAAKKCGGGTIRLSADEFNSWKYHNSTRASRGLSKLCVHPALQKAARAHSRDMINRDYFSHDTKGSGRDAGQRITAAGYRWRTYGENIGYNQSTPKAMHNAWMNSSGHRANILNGRFREIGIGAVNGNYNGSQVTMYTADFGAR